VQHYSLDFASFQVFCMGFADSANHAMSTTSAIYVGASGVLSETSHTLHNTTSFHP